jgi:hypothetical protein
MLIDYIGNVKLIKKDLTDKVIYEKTLKNSGTNNLFVFFINCLLGNLDSKAVPSFIDLRYAQDMEDDTVISSVTVNAGAQIVSASINDAIYPKDSEDSETHLAAYFTANFSKYDFVDPEIFQFDNRNVYLTITGNDKTIELARISIDEKDFKDITSLDEDQKVTIEWAMIIKNPSSSNSEV